MSKVIACIDGSVHADGVCALSAWISDKTNYPIALLHVVAPHSDMAAKSDLSGSIGLGAKSELLEELTKMDEARGKIEQRKGQLMLEHAKEELAMQNHTEVELLHRRGSLVETIEELEKDAHIIVMGKRGEQAEVAPEHLGSNLERVARTIHTPLLVATANPTPIKKFLIAYDGSPSSNKALEFVINNPLLKGLECHVLKKCEATGKAESLLKDAETQLSEAGFNVTTSFQQGKSVKEVVAGYIKENNIDLLVIGAYGHSKVRNFILGSTTTSLIHATKVPVLLFH